MMTKASAD